MRSGQSRRRFIQRLGTAVTGAIAGCGATSSGRRPESVTPAPVPTATGSRRPPTQTAGPRLAPRELDFDVTVVRPSDTSSPARLEVAVRNRSDSRVAALGESPFVLPFVDPDYAGTDESGEPGLLLVPDDNRLIVDPADGEPQRLAAALPDRPEGGCWRVPFAWPAPFRARNARLHAVSLLPDDTRRHQYALYFIDGCTTGSFTFENTFDLAVGRPPDEGSLYRARLGFVATVTDVQGIEIRVDEPTIASPPGGRGRR